MAYNSVSKWLHWLTVIAIAATAVLGWLAEEGEVGPTTLKLFVWHKSTGLFVLAIMVLRLCWSWLSTPPPSPLSTHEQHLARVGHWAIYAAGIALPVSGWLLNSAANFPLNWFGWFSVPAIWGPDEQVQKLAGNAHFILFWLLVTLIAGHIFMTVRHERKGSAILARMLPKRIPAIVHFSIILAASVLWVSLAWTLSNSTATPDKKASIPTAQNEYKQDKLQGSTTTQKPDATVTAPLWVANEQNGKIRFEATYDQIAFEGEFQSFTAQLHFDPNDLPGSMFHVQIDMEHATTFSSDRDEMLPTADWFNNALHKQSEYSARRFSPSAEGFIAHGQLTLKGISKPVDLFFDWQTYDDGKTASLYGEASVNRTEFKVGDGVWLNDPTIGFEVKITTHIQLNQP